LDKARKTHYRLFEHTADLGMEIFGDDPADLFINAGQALFEALLRRQGPASQAQHRRYITIQGQDWADLMINWLRELLYLFNGNQQVLIHIRMEALSPNELKAELTTEDFSPERHQAEQEIKAVTYHQIQVEPLEDGWRARVIFDI